MEVLQSNDANWLVQFDNGEVDTVTKSPLNRLLFDHDLWGLLKKGDEIVTYQGGENQPKVTVIPSDDATEFTLKVKDANDDLHLGEHHKPDLIDALKEAHEPDDGVDVLPIIDLYDTIREDMVRESVMERMADYGPFSEAVEPRSGGWLIHDHLLLTWEGDFYHPDTTSRNRSGSVIKDGARAEAYDLRLDSCSLPSADRDVTIGGEQYRLTDAEMEFIARGVWAVAEAPRERQANRNADGTQGTPGIN